MMHWRALVVLCLSLSFLTVACDDDDDDSDGLSYSGSNGLVIDGDGFDRVSVDTDSNSGSTSEVTFGGVTTGEASVTLSGTLDGETIVVRISSSRPGGAISTGEKNWGLASSGINSITVGVGGKTYGNGTSSGGSTTFSELGDRIKGRFSGTITEVGGSATIEISGRFDVEND